MKASPSVDVNMDDLPIDLGHLNGEYDDEAVDLDYLLPHSQTNHIHAIAKVF